MTTFEWHDEYLFDIHRKVERFGFAIQYVMGERAQPSWGYTIGFLAHGHPEVIVFGLGAESTSSALHHLYDEIRAGEGHRPVGAEHDQELRGVPIRILPVPDGHWDDVADRLCIAVSYYRGLRWRRSEMRAVQLVWATEGGAFPWDLACPLRMRRLQPVLAPGIRGAA